jgi:predicted O-methyltransferase YrrM
VGARPSPKQGTGAVGDAFPPARPDRRIGQWIVWALTKEVPVPPSATPPTATPPTATPPTATPPTARDYAETYLAEDAVLTAARRRAAEVGVVPVGSGAGAALRLLAAAVGARSVVEVGTGTGVSGVWLLRGMRPDGVLTTIDTEAEHQRLAREAFAEAGFAPARARTIAGRALEVLPRLADGSYDLVFCDAVKTEYPEYLTEALRLLRPGGMVAFDNALWNGKVADSAARDPQTVSLRELGRVVRDHDRLTAALLPVGDGLLTAVVGG